jgi:hypothetical protein
LPKNAKPKSKTSNKLAEKRDGIRFNLKTKVGKAYFCIIKIFFATFCVGKMLCYN